MWSLPLFELIKTQRYNIISMVLMKRVSKSKFPGHSGQLLTIKYNIMKKLFFLDDAQLHDIMQRAVYDWLLKKSRRNRDETSVPQSHNDDDIISSVQDSVVRAMGAGVIIPHLMDDSVDFNEIETLLQTINKNKPWN